MSQSRAGQSNIAVTRGADGFLTYDYDAPAAPQPSPAAKPKPAEDGMLRSLWKLPNGTLQVCEAFSQGGLDTLEAGLERWGATKIR